MAFQLWSEIFSILWSEELDCLHHTSMSAGKAGSSARTSIHWGDFSFTVCDSFRIGIGHDRPRQSRVKISFGGGEESVSCNLWIDISGGSGGWTGFLITANFPFS